MTRFFSELEPQSSKSKSQELAENDLEYEEMMVERELTKYKKEQDIVTGRVAYLELKVEKGYRPPKELNPMQLMRYFDPKLENITNIKEIKSNMGASTGRYTVFFKEPIMASRFVHRYDNDFFNTEEVNIPLKAYIYQLRKNGETKTEIQDRYSEVEKELGLFSQVQGYAHQKMRPADKKGWLMLYNLPFEVTAKDISEICKGYGKVVDMYMSESAKSKNRGYSIVKFEKEGSAKNMMNMVS